MVNFPVYLYSESYQYRSLNSYRSAIASMHAPVEGVSIGQYPLVSRLLKGAFQTRRPLPRYKSTWDINLLAKGFLGYKYPSEIIVSKDSYAISIDQTIPISGFGKTGSQRLWEHPRGFGAS